jgi:hydrogenase expression/formation protein HypC
MCLGIPGRITAIADAPGLMGVVEVSGVRRKVDLACVAGDGPLEALIGEWVLVHVGFAMSRIDAAEAAATLEALDALGEAQAEIAAMAASEAMLEEAAP